MKIFVLGLTALISFSVLAQPDQIAEIQKTFHQLKDLSRSESFSVLKGKSFKCDEYDFSPHQNKYLSYKTNLSFKAKVSSYYGNSTEEDYLEYADYFRTNAGQYAQVPHFGCDGIEWGVAYLKESPYLHMSNLYAQVGNSNLGPCYELKFRVENSGNIVALGEYKGKPVHLLKCLKK